MVVGFTVMNPMLESTNITQQKQIHDEMKLPKKQKSHILGILNKRPQLGGGKTLLGGQPATKSQDHDL